MYLGDVKRFERSLLVVIKHRRKGEALAPERDHELLALGLDRLQQLRLRAVHEARRQSLRHERSFHPADQRAVKFRGRKGREIEGLAGPVGEHDFARLQIEITNEKAGFLDLDFTSKMFQSNNVFTLPRQVLDRAIKMFTELPVPDRGTVVTKACVVMQHESKGPEGGWPRLPERAHRSHSAETR